MDLGGVPLESIRAIHHQCGRVVKASRADSRRTCSITANSLLPAHSNTSPGIDQLAWHLPNRRHEVVFEIALC